MLSTRGQQKQTPFALLVLCGTVDNENGVIRKFQPGIKTPTICRVPEDISYRNAGRHVAAGRMEYVPADKVEALSRKKEPKVPASVLA